MATNNNSKRRYWKCPIEMEQDQKEKDLKQAEEKDSASK